MSATAFKPGDWVRVVGVPQNLPDDQEMNTRALFELCVGKVFRIEDIEETEHSPLLELHVGHIVGRESFMETVWIEPEYVEPCQP